MILFAIVFLSIYGLINAYLFIRGWQAMPATSSCKITYTAIFLLLSLSFIVSMTMESLLPVGLTKGFYWLGSIWFGAMVYFLLFALVTDMVRAVNHFLPFLPDIITANYQKTKQIVLVSSIAITSVILLAGYIRFLNPSVQHYTINIDKKAGERKNLRIVMASDIHLGYTIGNKQLARYVKLINEQNPDIVLIAGDVVDRSIKPLYAYNIGKEFFDIKAPVGVYSIMGNHEYIGHADLTEKYLAEKTPVRLLKDTTIEIDSSFYIVGRDDRSNPDRMELSDLTNKLDKSLPIIVMDHQPYNLEKAVEAGADLQLSGHTHNGQFFPGNLIVKKMYELGYGYKQKGNTHFYVSSGLGLWGPPFRLGTVSEICVIDLKFK